MSDSSEGRLTPGGVAMTLLSVGIGLCALVLMYQGLGFIGVTVWGYNDSQPSFYIGVGVIFLLVGTGLFFMATLLAVGARRGAAAVLVVLVLVTLRFLRSKRRGRCRSIPPCVRSRPRHAA